MADNKLIMKKEKNYKELTITSLKEKKLKFLKEQFSLRMQKGTGQLTKNHMFKYIRRNIARINTELSNRKYK